MAHIDKNKIYLTRDRHIDGQKVKPFKGLFYIRPGFTIFGVKIAVRVPLKKIK